MSVGIIPLAIHVPAMAPMSSRMIIAGVALRIFVTIASSSVCHFVRYRPMAMSVQMAEAVRSDNWLPPAMASAPNKCIVSARRTTSTASGISATAIVGFFICEFPIFLFVNLIACKDK